MQGLKKWVGTEIIVAISGEISNGKMWTTKNIAYPHLSILIHIFTVINVIRKTKLNITYYIALNFNIYIYEMTYLA